MAIKIQGPSTPVIAHPEPAQVLHTRPAGVSPAAARSQVHDAPPLAPLAPLPGQSPPPVPPSDPAAPTASLAPLTQSAAPRIALAATRLAALGDLLGSERLSNTAASADG